MARWALNLNIFVVYTMDIWNNLNKPCRVLYTVTLNVMWSSKIIYVLF